MNRAFHRARRRIDSTLNDMISEARSALLRSLSFPLTGSSPNEAQAAPSPVARLDAGSPPPLVEGGEPGIAGGMSPGSDEADSSLIVWENPDVVNPPRRSTPRRRPSPAPQERNVPAQEEPAPVPHAPAKRQRPRSSTRMRTGSPLGLRFYLGGHTEIETSKGTIPARYALVDAEQLLTSHDPVSFAPNTEFPADCQHRRYDVDPLEQARVMRAAGDLHPRLLITDGPTAVDGPPIVAPSGVVLGSSGRVMALQRADDRHRYDDLLQERLAVFGLRPSDARRLHKPILVRLVDVREKEYPAYCRLFNGRSELAGLAQPPGRSRPVAARDGEFTDLVVEDISRVLAESSAESFVAAAADPAVSRRIVRALRAVGIVTDENERRWLDPASDALSMLGAHAAERLILANLLSDDRETGRNAAGDTIVAARPYAWKLLVAGSHIVRMRKLPHQWSLLPAIKDALALDEERRSRRVRSKEAFLASLSARRRPSDRALRVWERLDAPEPSFGRFLAAYVTSAEQEASRTDNRGFGGATAPAKTTDDILTEIPESALADRPFEMMTLADVHAIEPDPFPWSARFKRFMGNLPGRFHALLWGEPGGGKSTWSLQFADEVSRETPVLYVSAEEYLRAGSITHRAAVARAYSPDVTIVDTRDLEDLKRLLAQGRYGWCIIDSLNAMRSHDRPCKPDDLLGLQRTFPKIGFVYIAHRLKGGASFKGPSDFEHMVDAVAVFQDKTARWVKNRFQGSHPAAEFKVFGR